MKTSCFKRVIAACLFFVMLLSFFPAVGAAASEPAKVSQQEQDAIWQKYEAMRQKAADFQGGSVSQPGDGEALRQVRSQLLKKEPVQVMTQEDYASADDLFAQIEDMESAPEKKGLSQTQLADAAAEIVMASEAYVEGSLERNGNSFTWWTEDGIRCAYDPRLRELTGDLDTTANAANDLAHNEPDSFKAGSTSKQVYLIGPYYGYDDDFTNQYKTEASRIANAIGDSDGYTLYSGYSATVDSVATAVSNGAVVLFDSHGGTDYSNGDDSVTGAENSYLCLLSTSGMTNADYNDGSVYYGYGDGCGINGETIVNHMSKDSPAGLVWMAICLGMATNTLCNPLRNNGVEVVYGYSQSVTFGGDYLFEETFWDNMLDGKNVATSIANMKSAWGNWDWSTQIAKHYGYSDGYSSISAARSDYSAFPIVVSDQDSHPGQRSYSSYGADSLQTVKATYALNLQAGSGGGSGGTNPSDPAGNYDKLRNFIKTYGSTNDDGQKELLGSFERDGMFYAFTLTNVSTGIEFELGIISDGYESILIVNNFILQRNSTDLTVDFLMGLFYYDECYDAVDADGTIDRREVTTEPNYSVSASSSYISSSEVTEFFNLTIKLLCAYWDESIYNALGFGLYGLGFDSYKGYGYGAVPSDPIPEGMSYEIRGEEAVIIDYTGSAESVVIPGVIEGKPVTTIDYSAFSQCETLTSVTIPESVTSINESAFDGCASLKSITIPKSVTYIGQWAFLNCSSLTEIKVDSANTAYSSDSKGVLFDKKKTVLIQAPGALSGSYTVPSTVTTIADTAFYYCLKLTKVSMSSSVTEIGTSAFAWCENLTSITLGSQVTSIAGTAFAWCYSLTGITIPKSVTEISQWAFIGCSNMKAITVDKNNPNFSSDAAGVLFNKNKTALLAAPGAISGSYAIPSTVTTIGDGAFYVCSKLTGVTIPSGVTEIGDDAFFAAGLTSVTIPGSVKRTGYDAFSCCENLQSVVIQYGVETIDFYAFSWCEKLARVTIPKSVTTIEESAFEGCTALATVNYTGDEAGWSKITIGEYNEPLLSAELICRGDQPVSGDIDGNGEVNRDDVIALLLHVSMPAAFPIGVAADYNGDGAVTRDDVIALLLHVTMPDAFPL